MVEIARFTYPSEAEVLVALLKSEGIYCYIRDEFSSRIMAGYADIGGVRVELLESEAPRALQVMRENGYELPDENEYPDQIKAISGFSRHIPFLRSQPLEKQILVLLAAVAIGLAALLFAYKLLNPAY
jgi:hypothetical protein